MRPVIIISLVTSLILALSCSKEEDEEQITSFEGAVLYESTNEPFTSGKIEIIGSEPGFSDWDAYRESFQIEPDGSFDIQVTTINISHFQINLESLDSGTIYQSCTGSSITGFCTLMDAGKDHSGIRVYAQIIDSN
jgi:hypothetical protein